MAMRKSAFLFLTFLLVGLCATGRDPFLQRPPDAATIHRKMQKLGVLATVMYVAAHPDDENTRLISWFSRQRQARTVYLSLTRGDGGQNLIGTEIDELLGVLRTQELLAARRIDGGEQWFTRANDFGYSKTAEETMSIWNKEAVLADVVWAIRKFRPDIIVNRFNAENSGSTHGHHTASARLALEAFDLAGDPSAFPEQLQFVEPWQPRRIYFNTSWWQYGSQENFDKADKSRMARIDVGVYEPWSGWSNSEVAMRSRSMHRCQGFGSELYRGESLDYLDLLRGDLPPDKDDPLGGIDMDWTRIPGGKAIGRLVAALVKDYDFKDPSASLPALVKLKKSLESMPDHAWKTQKIREITEIIADCAGLFVEAKTSRTILVPGDTLTFQLEVSQRQGAAMQFRGLACEALGLDTSFTQTLSAATPWKGTFIRPLARTAPYTAPYWLTQPAEGGLYQVADQRLRGRPESASPANLTLRFEVQGISFDMDVPVVHKEVDPAYGERYQPMQVLPAAFVTPEQPVALFPGPGARDIAVKVKAGKDNLKGTVSIGLPSGWMAEPRSQEVSIPLQGDERVIRFRITPPATESVAEADLQIEVDGTTYPYSLYEVRYEHVPHQSVIQPAKARLVHVPLAGTDRKIGYIAGAGDQLPSCLREAGYGVDVLEDDDLTAENLAKYDALLAGVRAYNTRDGLKYRQEAIKQYIEGGGTFIVQYNTNRGLVTNPSPLPLKVSRERVTDEKAAIRLLQPTHPALTGPNAIGAKDFEGWVQERGLYFPDSWDKAFTPLLAAADPGEKESEGLLLVAPYGKGHYIYTGLAFFRQLPAGVPGAYRLLANLIALGNTDKP